MKKTSFALFCLSLILTGCGGPVSYTWNEIENTFTGTEYKGNYVYSPAMNLAWNELKEEVIGAPLQLQTTDEEILETVRLLNESPFSTDDLEEKNYYIKAGYGPETLKAINEESREKFPDKSFEDLDFNVGDNDILSYAYLNIEVEYPSAFTETQVSFNEEFIVEGFTFEMEKQRKNLEVIDYTDKDNFILSFDLTSKKDGLYIVKGMDNASPEEVMNFLNSKLTDEIASGEVAEEEYFAMPFVDLELHRDYEEFIGLSLLNPGFEGQVIAHMFENLNFHLDETGAKVENEGVIHTKDTGLPNETVRSFIMDKPFWIIMKKTNSGLPYFLMHVEKSSVLSPLLID